jgi:hypothetical protein
MTNKRTIKKTRQATLARISELRALTRDGDAARDAFVAKFDTDKERQEARLLLHWLLTKNISTFLMLEPDSEIGRGEDPPDFLLCGDEEIAVEATTFVTPRKAMFDKEEPFEGAYTSTLLDTRPDPEFKAALKKHELPDNSRVRPGFVASDLTEDAYFRTMQPVIEDKLKAAKNYSALYSEVIILVRDSLSELELVLEKRLPTLRDFAARFTPPTNVSVVVMNSGYGSSGIAHKL